MKLRFLLAKMSLLLLVPFSIMGQVKILFDTDFGGDADDLGALAMLHHFVDHKECELLGIMVWSTEEHVVPAIDAINRYYKHPEIPIGVRKGDLYNDPNNYSKSIADSFPYELTAGSAPDATELYRKILSENADQSLIIVTVGPLKNIQDLINSPGDKYSSLNGLELIHKKVKEFVIMGGNFPEGNFEWNFSGFMPGVTQYVLENLSVPITFSGFELGVQIKSGAVFNQIDRNTPLYIGFMHFSEYAPWMKARFKGEILDNSTFDQTAVLYAVRQGVGDYWERIGDGFCLADEKGGNTWIDKVPSHHSYLKLTLEPEKMANLIESIMLNQF